MDRINWTNKCYRFSHSVFRLHPAMLSTGFEKKIDGYIVLFDRDYVVFRIALLLTPLKVLPLATVLKLLADTVVYIEKEWSLPTPVKDDTNQSTQA